MVENGVSVVQKLQTQYQSLPHDEEALNINPIQHGYQPIASTLASFTTACLDKAGVQINQKQCEMVSAGKENISQLPQPHFIKVSSTALQKGNYAESSTPGV